jgi:putative ABC transport system permease protein
MDEVRLALRRVTKRPGAALASIVTLGAAIGAAAATMSLLSAVLLRPLPVAEPDRLAVVGQREAGGRYAGLVRDNQIYPLFPLLRDSGIFEDVAAGGSWGLRVNANANALPQNTRVYFATANFFDLLGVHISVGRGFRSEEDRRGAPVVALLADRYWRRTFGADAGVIGRTITVGGKPATVVGVVPRGFRGLDLSYAPDIYLPLHTVADVAEPTTNFFAEDNPHYSPTSWLTIVGRIGAGSTFARAAAQVAALKPPRADYVTSRYLLTGVNTAALPSYSRAAMAQFTRLLGATVGLLLLIGCATVGMLLLVRTEARREEFAMCLALGATRARLARGVAIEGAILSIAGALLALPIAQWLFAGLRAFKLPGGVEIDLLDLSVDGRVLADAAGCAIAGTLLIAVVAGAFGFSADIADAIRSRSGATPRTTRRRTRTILVAGQVAVSLVLLAGAGLFARSLIAALRLNPGYDTSRIVTGDVLPRPQGYTMARALTFFADLAERLSASPAVRSVSLTESQSAMTPGGTLVIDGQPRVMRSRLSFTAIDDRYLPTMGLRITKGRPFSSDDSPQSPLVGLASESLARMLGNGGDPIGHRIEMPVRLNGQPAPVVEIVGVVPDVITRVTDLEPFDLYLPLAQAPLRSTSRTIVVQAARDAPAARREILNAIRQLDATVIPAPMLTIDELLNQQMSSQQFGVVVLTALGVIAVLLTVLGTYVLAESMAVLRMREMGIRAALGASGRQLGAIVLAETARLVGLGLLVGLLLAWMGASTIRAFLFKVQPLDLATLAGVAATILLLALTVSLRPAWRAARVDLGTVLKEE